MSLRYHVLPIKMPSDLANKENGKLPPHLLAKLKGTSGAMHPKAATAFNCLQMHAFFAGIDLQSTSTADTYRSYERQERTFLDRYAEKFTNRVPPVFRTWNRKRYWLKKGKAPSATPGTSNHGWGLAIDVAGASGKRLAWMLGPSAWESPVLKFGFSWEVASGKNAESWHIRYVCGDEYPPAVVEALKVFPELEAK